MYSLVLSLAIAGSTESPDVLCRCRFYTPTIAVAWYPWWGPIYPYAVYYPWFCPWVYTPYFTYYGWGYNPWFAYYPWYYPAVGAPAPAKLPAKKDSMKEGGAPKKSAEPAPKPPPPPPKKEASLIHIKVPAGAKLLVDGQPAPPTGVEKDGVKTFRTPELLAGAAHSYTFGVVMNEKGATISRSKVVPFRAGETVTVDLTGPATGVAANPR